MKRPVRESKLRLPTLVCAWCKGVIRAGTPDISHGICHSCAVKFSGKNERATSRRVAA